MSVDALSWVAKHSRAKANERLVLMGIADAADGSGCNAWPGIQRLAMFANVDERTVQRAVRSLVDAGEIFVEKNKGGMPDTRGNRRPNRYTILGMVRGDSDATPSSGDNGVTPRRSGVTDRPPRGDKSDSPGVTLVSQEHPGNVLIERAGEQSSVVDIPAPIDISERVDAMRSHLRQSVVVP